MISSFSLSEKTFINWNDVVNQHCINPYTARVVAHMNILFKHFYDFNPSTMSVFPHHYACSIEKTNFKRSLQNFFSIIRIHFQTHIIIFITFIIITFIHMTGTSRGKNIFNETNLERSSTCRPKIVYGTWRSYSISKTRKYVVSVGFRFNSKMFKG